MCQVYIRSRVSCVDKSIAKSNKVVYSRIMTKLRKLGEVAEIHSGYSFRGAVIDVETGVSVVQARDIDGLYVKADELPQVLQHFSSSRMLNHGDVLLTARGSFRAAIVGFDKLAVASSSLFVLRLKDSSYLSEFLALYLSSSQAQSYLVQSAKGATIQSLSVNDLAGLSIPVVSKERQKLIVGLQQNVEAQTSLLRSKLDIVNDIYIGAINKNLKGVA